MELSKISGTETPKKIPYISGKGNRKKSSYVFLKESFSYISGNGNLRKDPYISGNGNPKKATLKKSLLIFQENELSNLKLKKLPWPENQTFLILVFKHKRKRKKFLILFLIKKQNFLN